MAPFTGSQAIDDERDEGGEGQQGHDDHLDPGKWLSPEQESVGGLQLRDVEKVSEKVSQ